jgi:cell division control protein 6
MSDIKDPLGSIFDRAMKNQVIFKNKNALRSEYIPNELHFRDDQITRIGQILSPILNRDKPSNLLIYGKTGTGKTVVTRYVLNRLIERTKKTAMDVKVGYVNTRVASTEYRVLTELAHSIGIILPFTGLSISEAFHRITEHIKATQTKAIFALDEIDFLVKLSGDNLLYELTRANESMPQTSFITLIGISNDLKFKDNLDARVLSSLNEEETVFSPYTVDELKAILLERVNIAFNTDVVTEAAINLCAGMAGSEHGDARRAVDLLRVAGELAEREGAGEVRDEHVRQAAQSIERDRIFEGIQSLPIHGKLTLLAVSRGREPENTGHIYARYIALAKQLGLEPLTQRRISGLLSELDLLGLISAPVISQGRMGRSKKISLAIQTDVLKAALTEDETLKPLF